MAPNYHAQAIGTAVRSIIVEAGLTVSNAAEQADIPRMSFYRRINGQVEFTYSELVSLAAITGVSLGEIVERAQRITERAAS